ncbi:MAG TPA: thioredoxin family protein [Pirellulales bacterium]
MTGLTLAALMHISVAVTGADAYHTAYAEAKENGKPLVVLVGTDWCPGCVTMKNSVMPEAARRGILSKANVAVVNADRQPELAQKLMRGASIPQLIVFTKTHEGWRRKQVTGATTVATIEEMIEAGIAAGEPKTAVVARPTSDVKAVKPE